MSLNAKKTMKIQKNTSGTLSLNINVNRETLQQVNEYLGCSIHDDVRSKELLKRDVNVNLRRRDAWLLCEERGVLWLWDIDLQYDNSK